jgi:TPR repeat protein
MGQVPRGGRGGVRRWYGPMVLVCVVVVVLQLAHPVAGWLGWLFTGATVFGALMAFTLDWLASRGQPADRDQPGRLPPDSGAAGLAATGWPAAPGPGSAGAATPGPAVVEPVGGAVRVGPGSLRARLHPAAVEVPYVRRDAATALAAALSAGRAALLVGPSMAGKTRLAAEVVESMFAGRPLVVPADKAALLRLGTDTPYPRGCVIWLDDLDRLIAADGITDRDLRRLAAVNTVVATLRAQLLRAYRPGEMTWGAEWDVVAVFERIQVERRLSAAELDRVAQAVSDDAAARREIQRLGLGEYIGGGARITGRLATGRTANPMGWAYVRGAADLQRIGVAGAVAGTLLPALAGAYLDPDARREPGAGAGALDWATGAGGSAPALLVPAGDDAYAVHDRALDHLSEGNPAIPAATWQLGIDHGTAGDLLRIGYYARTAHDADDIAERALHRAVETGCPGALAELASAQLERGELANALETLDQAVTAGDVDALNTVGMFLAASGELTAAERYLRLALAAGQPDAALNLGKLMADRGKVRKAYRYYRQALAGGDVDALNNIGILYAERRMYRQAERLFRTAADAGSVEGIYNLGNLMFVRGDHPQAQRYYRQASDIGHQEARSRLDALTAGPAAADPAGSEG